MIVDLILDRKDFESEETVSVADSKFSDFWVPALSVFPVEEVPENLRSCYVWQYSPRAFYHAVREYEDDFKFKPEISMAMDYGTEDDVKRALCNYIDKQDYNPAIKDYINSVNWL